DALPSITDRITVTRWGREGTAWDGAVIRNSVGDREAVAADTGPHSPYRGHVYVSWHDIVADRLAVARSLGTRRGLHETIYIGGRNGMPQSQPLVAPDGTVHVLWTHPFRANPDAEEPETGTGLFQAVSTDGGLSFEERGVVVRHAGARRVSIVA